MLKLISTTFHPLTQVVQEEAVESMIFQVAKEMPKNVFFSFTDSIIPYQPEAAALQVSIDVVDGDPVEGEESVGKSSQPPEVIVESDTSNSDVGSGEPGLRSARPTVSFQTETNDPKASVGASHVNGFGYGQDDGIGGIGENGNGGNGAVDDRESTDSFSRDGPERSNIIQVPEVSEGDDDRLARFADLADPGDNSSEVTPPTLSLPPSSTNGRISPIIKVSTPSQFSNSTRPVNPAAPKSAQPAQPAQPTQPSFTTALIFNRPQRELSRLLVEKIPLEILKRMVIRWPVGDEQFQDRSELNANRLMINVWDASGDPLQQSFIPFFYSDRSIFVMTYDLTKNLDAPCESYHAKNLRNVDGSISTNAEVLESWIGCVIAHSKDTPALPFKCTRKTPVLPPIIITCTNSDCDRAEQSAVGFVKFFSRKSFTTYKKHLVEASSPTAVRISNRYETLTNGCENDAESQYSGHHMLRREIDYLARQMPYIHDEVPIQWVKFEQLLCGLQQQKKVILLFDDLSKYVTEHCQMSGPLRILPVLSQFHDIGTVVFFYRHPELNKLVITKPQWLVSALGSIITSSPGTWITTEVKTAFKKLGQCGVIGKDMVQLAYRCARMGQRHWNEMLYILNCMDLLCCHPSLHEKKSFYLPSMVVVGAPDPFYIPSDRDPVPVCFSTGESAFPIALFNQLVVRCVRSSQYEPTFYYQLAHLRLNSSHHLLLWKEHTSVICLVQSGVGEFCPTCKSKDNLYEFSPSCSSIAHMIGDQSDLMPSDNISRLIEMSTNSGVDPNVHLSFPDSIELSYPDSLNTLDNICPRVLAFIIKNLQFLCNCWFPGLNVQLQAEVDSTSTILDQQWRHTVLNAGNVPKGLQVWFD